VDRLTAVAPSAMRADHLTAVAPIAMRAWLGDAQ
jgi:hypothetical protein